MRFELLYLEYSSVEVKHTVSRLSAHQGQTEREREGGWEEEDVERWITEIGGGHRRKGSERV